MACRMGNAAGGRPVARAAAADIGIAANGMSRTREAIKSVPIGDGGHGIEMAPYFAGPAGATP